MKDLTERSLSLNAQQRHDVIAAYIARKLTVKHERGRHWVPPHGQTTTDVYNILHAFGYSDLVGATRGEIELWLSTHPEFDPRVTPESTSNTLPVPAPVVVPSGNAFVLDAALLEQLIRAEVQRVVQTLKGEIEIHVRKETQAAVEREGDRAASALAHRMATTLDTAITLEVQRQLEEFTS